MRWYRVGGLDYLLKRSDFDEPEAGSRPGQVRVLRPAERMISATRVTSS
jgi:hypothetical protein